MAKSKLSVRGKAFHKHMSKGRKGFGEYKRVLAWEEQKKQRARSLKLRQVLKLKNRKKKARREIIKENGLLSVLK